MAKKVSSKKKKQLIKAIKTPVRYFRIEFGRYGGEVAMGSITPEQYSYWEGKDEEFGEYMANVGFDAESANKDIPPEAQFDKEFYEYEDICHTSGPELSDGQYMIVTEVDKHGDYLKDEQGAFIEDERIDMEQFKKLGVQVTCTGEHNCSSDSCKDKYYMFGQYFNKGGWHSPEPIKTGPDGIDFKKLEINYENADGFKVIGGFLYNGEEFYLEEDSTGKSSSFYVMEGDDV